MDKVFYTFMTILQETVEKRRAVGSIFDKLLEGSESSIFLPMADIEDTMIHEITALFECDDWISWFVYENNFGLNNLIVELQGKEFTVDSIKSLYYVILASKESHGNP